MPEIGLPSVAVLAAVTISGEKECVGNLAAKTAGDMHELDESNNCRFGKRQAFAANEVASVRFDDLRLSLDDEAERAPNRDHRQRLKGGVQRQTPHRAVS
jgi:hypothetical protein